MRAIYKTAQPIPRTGLPNDIPQGAVFLASDESSFINGHDLVIDGARNGADLARFIGRPTNPYQITITPVCA
jgi:NAD(P)-dependent dehydrogenase (short-subunit alcohol dehydrogenase family)